MKSRTIAIIAALLVFIIAFFFLVPVVSYPMPAGVYSVPPSYVKYGSIAYWALGAGGTWRYIGHGAEGYTQGYSVSVVTATASTSSTSTVSYTSTTANFLYRTMPKEFTVNGYTFYMRYNGTGFTAAQNGTATANLGFSLVLAVSDGTRNQTVTFGWAPPAPEPKSLPVPNNASLYNGKVELSWFTDNTGTYLRIIAA